METAATTRVWAGSTFKIDTKDKLSASKLVRLCVLSESRPIGTRMRHWTRISRGGGEKICVRGGLIWG